MSVIDKCFKILASPANIDEAMGLIKKMLLAENVDNAQTRLQIEANPLDYLVRNISARTVQTAQQIEEQEAQEAALDEEQKRLDFEFKERQKTLSEPEQRKEQTQYLEAKRQSRVEEDKRMEELEKAKELEYRHSVQLRMESF